MIKTKFDLHEIVKERNRKFHGFVDLAQKVDGSKVRLPYMIVCGKEDGPILLAGSCIHGDEYEGAEGISKVYNELDPETLKGTFVGVPAVNLEAFNAGSRISPIDWSSQDMNRAYPGNPNGMITSRITNYYYENFIKKADYVISFHGGGNGLYMEPLSTYQPPSQAVGETTYRMAKAAGVRVLWRNGEDNFPGVETEASSAAGKPCINIELGGHSIRNDHRDEIIAIAARAITGVLQEFDLIPGTPAYRDDCVEVDITYVNTDDGGYHKLKCKAMEMVREGQVCSEIVDIFGQKIGEVKAPFDGYVCGYWVYSTIHPGNWAFLFGRPLEPLCK